MKITKKIELIRNLSNALRNRYDDKDLEMFFQHYKLNVTWVDLGNYEYEIDVKSTLSGGSDDILIEISSELETGGEYIVNALPKNWESSHNLFKVFISHLSEHKDKATRLKEALRPYYMDCFVAHEDIYPSLEWQEEILKALLSMDVFISIHCENFRNSIWCQQEIGAAMARRIKIIPVKFDGKENPEGFISRIQGLSRASKDRHVLAKEIVEIIKEDEKTAKKYEGVCLKNESKDFNGKINDEEIPF